MRVCCQAAGAANGPLMEELRRICGYTYSGGIKQFRKGGEVIDRLEPSGHYQAKAETAELSVQEVVEQRRARNDKLIKSLRPDEHARRLHQMTLEDAEKGRMTKPRPLQDSDLDQYNLAPRFIVCQGGP